MRYGEMFANLAMLLLLALTVGGIFLLFGEPLWPPRHANMVLVSELDAVTTASTRKSCDPAPCLPDTLDADKLPSRPMD
ncbi:polymerase [Mesorhizobium sp. M9A.F.Ca.ET.002.03.1.2]|uniref:polymerase n=1 Tax=Mesorhizobium sp. M9A.F.Ca.ET.002.03.1.2 TaxID=2493668 RepID=UPI000F756C49|nr:polymerase [Mesorhizobium sp. M9A.F.Ca.ET.002.03.1.2]AZN98775.1 polymerase [Mesorhizobium sp. M9A.F.Ca.ET.002.03.1.2]